MAGKQTPQTAFRLSPDILEKLDYLQVELNKKNRTETIREVIQKVYDRYTNEQKAEKDSDTSNTDSDTSGKVSLPVEVFEDYRARIAAQEKQLAKKDQQLEAKDQQLEALNQALQKEQDDNREKTAALREAQVLHAQTLKALDKATEKEPGQLAQATQATETETTGATTADPPIGGMTFRQVWKLWRRQRKE